ncbi:hypothetical protein PR048_005849 [Dryococelus australis]|uniref:STAS domain-containing protein n=1 Tax=Dryococelus australis TaxID=614101 RepID=A0ABQ9IBH2_9NEOP|nr:hypothetical protein PR048_005849 [Dryococelus australis]
MILPAPTLPPFTLLAEVALDSITVTMVSYTITMSMALIFAQKLSYKVDSNQELLALVGGADLVHSSANDMHAHFWDHTCPVGDLVCCGACDYGRGAGNVVGSFFSCMPSCASLSRSLVQQTVGGKTQLASVVSCAILLFVLLWIGPFFEPLPRCVLASIIIVALKGMLLQVCKVPKFCRLSILDGIVWMVTFFTVVLVDIDFGLLAGVVISLVSIFIQGMKPYTCLLGTIPDTDLYLDMNKYKGKQSSDTHETPHDRVKLCRERKAIINASERFNTQEVPGIKIFHYCGGLIFATRDHFREELIRLVGVNPQAELHRMMKRSRRKTMPPKDGIVNVSFVGDEVTGLTNLVEDDKTRFKSLILDFSALSYIDPSGVNTVKILEEEFQKIDIPVYLAGSSCKYVMEFPQRVHNFQSFWNTK